jgi:hypothetical protein
MNSHVRWRITKPLDQPAPQAWLGSRAGPSQRVGDNEWPAVPALRDSASIADALRSLVRLWLPPHSPAYDHLWSNPSDPVAWLAHPPARPAECDVVLVVDGSFTMTWWTETVAEFTELVRAQPFRLVRVCHLDTEAPVVERPYELGNDGHRTTVSLGESERQQLVLVLTDASARAWRTGSALRLIQEWGRTNPVAVINLVPQPYWPQSGLKTVTVELRSPAPGSPNEPMTWARAIAPDAALNHDRPVPDDGCAVPVLALDGRSLRTWGTVTAGSMWKRIPIADAGDSDELASVFDLTLPDVDRPPSERVYQFRAVATPEAFRLATLLAAAPLNLPVMRLVQGTLLPHSTPFDLHQVLTGDLLEHLGPRTEVTTPWRVTFEFLPGIRRELLSHGTSNDTRRVLTLVEEYLSRQVPAVRGLSGALTDPNAAPVPTTVTPETRPYVAVELAVLEALSGPYRGRAGRLRQLLNPGEQA